MQVVRRPALSYSSIISRLTCSHAVTLSLVVRSDYPDAGQVNLEAPSPSPAVVLLARTTLQTSPYTKPTECHDQ